MELDNKIARIIFNRWPEFVTRKAIEFKFAESIYFGEFDLTSLPAQRQAGIHPTFSSKFIIRCAIFIILINDYPSCLLLVFSHLIPIVTNHQVKILATYPRAMTGDHFR
jgi:hypothetical protein